MTKFLQLCILGSETWTASLDDRVKVRKTKDKESEPFLNVVMLSKDEASGNYKDYMGWETPLLFVWPEGVRMPKDTADAHHVYAKNAGDLLVSRTFGDPDETSKARDANSTLLLRIAHKMFGDLAEIQALEKSLSAVAHLVKTKEKMSSTDDIIKLGTGVSLVTDKTFRNILLHDGIKAEFASKVCAGLNVVEEDGGSTLHVFMAKNTQEVESNEWKDDAECIFLVPYGEKAALATIQAVAKLRRIRVQAVPEKALTDGALLEKMVAAVLSRMKRSAGTTMRTVEQDLNLKDALEQAGEAADRLEVTFE